MPKFKVVITELVEETREVECDAESPLEAARLAASRYLTSAVPRDPDRATVESRDYEVLAGGEVHLLHDVDLVGQPAGSTGPNRPKPTSRR